MQLDTIHTGDCVEWLKGNTFPDGCVVITDPPYGLSFRGQSWDASIPDGWLDAARRVVRIVIFTTAPTTLWDYPRPDWVLCWYRPAAVSRAVSGGFNHWTPICVYGKVKFPTDCLRHQKPYPSGFGHPSPKPVHLLSWLIEHATNEGDTIIDPFMGSGTTAVACIRMGRHFLGCEIEPKYVEIAHKRIAQARNDTAMFAGCD